MPCIGDLNYQFSHLICFGTLNLLVDSCSGTNKLAVSSSVLQLELVQTLHLARANLA